MRCWIAALLAIIASQACSLGCRRYHEPALHVEFTAVPPPLVSVAAVIPGSVCEVPVRGLSTSTSPVLREVARVLNGQGTLEPSFGCAVLAPGAVDDRAKFWTLRVPGSPSDGLLFGLRDALQLIPGVTRVAPVPKARPPQSSEGDPLLGSDATDDRTGSTAGHGTQWYLHACRVPQAWDLAWTTAYQARAPLVAVVDFGFRTTHDELANVLDEGMAWNSCDESHTVNWGSEIGHGTGTLGLLAAPRDDVGMVGVAPGITVWPIQASCAAPVSGDPWAKAVDRVRTSVPAGRRAMILLEVEQADGTNYESNLVLNEAIKKAVGANIVVVMAAGNGKADVSKTRRGDPIPETGSILVGATKYNPIGRRWKKSNFGARVVVSAPGDPDRDLTLSGAGDDLHRQFGGTSGAAAKVAGVVAMMLSRNTALEATEVKEILGRVGDLVDSDPAKPAGRHLNAEKGLLEAGTN